MDPIFQRGEAAPEEPVEPPKILPYEVDAEGNKVFDITGLKNTKLNANREYAGAIVIDGKKRYKISPDGSLRRIDKKRRKR